MLERYIDRLDHFHCATNPGHSKSTVTSSGVVPPPAQAPHEYITTDPARKQCHAQVTTVSRVSNAIEQVDHHLDAVSTVSSDDTSKGTTTWVWKAKRGESLKWKQ